MSRTVRHLPSLSILSMQELRQQSSIDHNTTILTRGSSQEQPTDGSRSLTAVPSIPKSTYFTTDAFPENGANSPHCRQNSYGFRAKCHQSRKNSTKYSGVTMKFITSLGFDQFNHFFRSFRTFLLLFLSIVSFCFVSLIPSSRQSSLCSVPDISGKLCDVVQVVPYLHLQAFFIYALVEPQIVMAVIFVFQFPSPGSKFAANFVGGRFREGAISPASLDR